MEEAGEKRGPVEKGSKGWPINPLGVAALGFFALIIAFLIIRPLLTQKAPPISQVQQISEGGRIISPTPGQITKENTLALELSVDNPEDVQKVQFWVKTYVDNKWTMVGEINEKPFKLDWQIPQEFKNKSIAVTSHIYAKDGKLIKDPGGWIEGVILLSQ